MRVDLRANTERHSYRDPAGKRYKNPPRPAGRGSHRRYPCPTCHEPRALSASEHARGYQCRTCAMIETGAY